MDEIVAMDATKLKFAKRKLRVTRCKTAGDNSSSSKRNARDDPKSSDQPPKKSEKTKLPRVKGDPLLGERIKGLSKEERKDAKKQDPNRLARRMDKKKARLAMERNLKRPEKERVRVRKVATMKSSNKKGRPAQKTAT